MAEQDSYVQVATDGSGKKIDNAVLTREGSTASGAYVAGDTVYRQRIVIGDDENPKLRAKLSGEYGDGRLHVEAKMLSDIHGELVQIREILQILVGT